VKLLLAKVLFTNGMRPEGTRFGGMNVSEAKRLRQLEAENAQLKRIVADQAVDIVALKDVLQKMVTPAARKEAVHCLQEEHALSRGRHVHCQALPLVVGSGELMRGNAWRWYWRN